jgi:hypothetical protein
LFLLFATGISNTSGAGVVDTGGAPSLANISANFRKNWKSPYVIFRGLGENDS